MSLFSKADKYYSLVRIEVLDYLQGRFDLIFGFIFLGIIIFVYYQLWTIGLENTSILGYTLPKIIFYVAVTESIWMSVGRIHKVIDEEIKRGLIVNYISKPVYYIFFHYFRGLGKAIAAFGINITLAFLLCTLLLGTFPFGWVEVLGLLLLSFLGISLLLLLSIFFGLLGYLTEKTEPFYLLYSKMIYIFGGLVFPVDLYPDWLRNIANLLPFQWGNFAIGKVFTTFSLTALYQTLISQLIWMAITLLLCHVAFSFISKRFTVQGG